MMEEKDQKILAGLLKMLEQLRIDKGDKPYAKTYVDLLYDKKIKETIEFLKKIQYEWGQRDVVAGESTQVDSPPQTQTWSLDSERGPRFLQDVVNSILQNNDFLRRVSEKVRELSLTDDLSDNNEKLSTPFMREDLAVPITVEADDSNLNQDTDGVLHYPKEIEPEPPERKSAELAPHLSESRRQHMAKLIEEYNISGNTFREHVKLGLEDEEAWGQHPKHFNDLETAQQLPLKEISGNGRFRAIHDEGNYYFLVPMKGIVFTSESILKYGYEQFFELDSLESLTGSQSHIKLIKPAILEKRNDLYYLVERGQVEF